ncbi:hypothetical protein AVEN_109891-1 [Araneus ventricosus]|uniref:Uncharacterized protein n=1 Tax=Araneus ventricosus TaxID=182803 RepID=A0A4Y2N320_ARAVE|nr:hypothetical protein AVEN_109891-1 [Araneus ventricosus]
MRSIDFMLSPTSKHSLSHVGLARILGHQTTVLLKFMSKVIFACFQSCASAIVSSGQGHLHEHQTGKRQFQDPRQRPQTAGHTSRSDPDAPDSKPRGCHNTLLLPFRSAVSMSPHPSPVSLLFRECCIPRTICLPSWASSLLQTF